METRVIVTINFQSSHLTKYVRSSKNIFNVFVSTILKPQIIHFQTIKLRYILSTTNSEQKLLAKCGPNVDYVYVHSTSAIYIQFEKYSYFSYQELALQQNLNLARKFKYLYGFFISRTELNWRTSRLCAALQIGLDLSLSHYAPSAPF